AIRDDGRYFADRITRIAKHEIVNDGSTSLADLVHAVERNAAQLRLIAETLHYYDGPAFEGLQLGQIGKQGALVRSEVLALTDEIAAAAYADVPPYLADGEPWSEGYPAEFRALLPPAAGYVHRSGSYYAQSERRRYDFHEGASGRGL